MYGFLGAGNMAGAIIRGMVKNGFAPTEIVAYDKSELQTETLSSELGILTASSQSELISKSDVLILAVKPQILKKIIGTVRKDIQGKQLVIVSIAVGIPLSYYQTELTDTLPVFRVMPNINALYNGSTTGICSNTDNPEYFDMVEEIFSSVGSVNRIDEELFGIFGALAGSTPAFVYLYANALKTGAIKAGMNKDMARKLIAETIAGSAKTILESDQGLWDLIDLVTSPKGTTIEGISALQENNFEATVIKGFDAIIEKDKKIKESK